MEREHPGLTMTDSEALALAGPLVMALYDDGAIETEYMEVAAPILARHLKSAVEAERKANMGAICESCACGKPVDEDGDHHYRNDSTGASLMTYPCLARTILNRVKHARS